METVSKSSLWVSCGISQNTLLAETNVTSTQNELCDHGLPSQLLITIYHKIHYWQRPTSRAPRTNSVIMAYHHSFSPQYVQKAMSKSGGMMTTQQSMGDLISGSFVVCHKANRAETNITDMTFPPRSNSDWVSSIVFNRKSNGKLRIC